MLRKSSHRVVAVVCCVICLAAGALPAAALPGLDLDSAPARSFEPGAWLARLWRLAGEPVASLFAADGTQHPPAPTPPTSEAGMTIDPDGGPGA